MNIELIPYIPPHPNAPLFIRKTKGIYIDSNTKKSKPKVKTSRSTQGEFKKKNPEVKKTTKELTNIIRTFNKNLCEVALNNRAGVLLPYRMGKLQVVMCRSVKSNNFDEHTSKKLGYKVYFNRLKNAGKFPLAQLDFYSESCNLPNKEFWEFKANPVLKKNIQNVLLIDRTRFSDVKNTLSIYGRRDRFYKKEFAIKNEEELLKTYNEFDFS
jgi:hypothetical protein